MPTIKITEAQYKVLMENIQNPDQLNEEGIIDDVTKKAKDVLNSFGLVTCLPAQMMGFAWYVATNKRNIMGKLKITEKELIMFTKAAIGIMGRESSFTQLIHLDGSQMFTPRYLKKNIYNFLGKYKFFRDQKILGKTLGGKTGSYGPAQMRQSTWNSLNMKGLFGMSDEQLYDIIGAGMATIVNLNNNYKLAKSIGYSSSTKSNIAGTGNGALDISIAAHNIGTPIRYCRTNDPKIAAPCDAPNHKYKPYPKENPKLVLNVLPDQIANYIPNKRTEKYSSEYENTPLTTHGYVKEVANYMAQFTCLDKLSLF